MFDFEPAANMVKPYAIQKVQGKVAKLLIMEFIKKFAIAKAIFTDLETILVN